MTQSLYYSSNAVAMTLTVGIASGDTTCTLSSTSGLPASFPFKLLLDWEAASQEVVYCTGLSGSVATIQRGKDGTTAQAHSLGATVVHGVSAEEYNNADAHRSLTSGTHGITGLFVGTSDTQTLTNKTIDGAVLDAASTLGGVSGTSLAADRTAWTAYTPSWTSDGTNPTIGNGTIVGRYKQIGKTVLYVARITIGSTTTLGTGSFYRISLPVTPFGNGPVGEAFANGSGGNVSGSHYYDGAFTFVYGISVANAVLVAGELLSVAGSYEAA